MRNTSIIWISPNRQNPGTAFWQNFAAKLLTITLLCLFSTFRANAQNPGCAMACSANVNVEMDADCSVQLLPSNVLMGLPPCPGPYELYLVNSAGDTLLNGVVTSAEVGQTLMATVYHPASTNKCMGNVHVSDVTPPTLVCPDITVACNADISPQVIGFPIVTDNCPATNFNLQGPNDNIMMDGLCSDPYTKKIMRLWNARDAANNVASCLQMITMQRPILADVVFPGRDTIAVGTVADPSVTGFPKISGAAIDLVACDMFSNPFDFDTIPICPIPGTPIEYMILREWRVIDNCLNLLRKDTQEIVIKDMIAPTLTCPPNSTVSLVADECFADIPTLPFPIVSAPDVATVQWQFGNGFGPWDSIPPGNYTLTYRATDCSHTRTCTMVLSVKDTQTPNAVLIGNRVVGLSAGGTFTMNASDFDQGSFDNCDDVYFEVSRDGVNFFDKITFNCSDVGGQVMVQVRVIELNNPLNFTTGMVVVTVQDKLGPTLTFAPQNITVDCLYDYQNPTLGGSNTPVFVDNCGLDTVIYEIIENVNNCGNGTVRRIWTAYDVFGNKTKFTQVVTVQNQHLFTEANIVWPQNYVTTTCGASLDFDVIPAPFKEPVTNDPGCSQIAVSYTDQVFSIGGPACKKVMRKWSVVDWCQYDPNHPDAGGRWNYTQVLQVMDGIAPTLEVPGDLTVTVGPDCLKGEAVLADATASDCSTMLNITNNSPHANSPAQNASGNYPLGVHIVAFKASDGCGNLTQKTVKITVVDNKPPTAICLNGLSTTLLPMASGPMVMLDATLFNAGSSDYCTVANSLKFNIKKAGTPDFPTPSISFDCNELGLQIVEMHVTDLKGNVGICQTYVLVQDNSGLCGPSTNPNDKAGIAGKIETESGAKVEGVKVMLPNFQNAVPVNTDAAGSFIIPNLPMHGNYDVKPEKDGDDINGVTTLDLALLSKHILGVQPLPTPYKIIAGDINRSGTITSFDIIEMRKLLLGIYTEFPNVNSWRFVDKNFTFPNPDNPFQTSFPEVKSIANLSADSAAQFTAIKVGDLNGTAQTNTLTSGDDRNEKPDLELVADDQMYEEGDVFAFSIKAANRQEVNAMSFSIEFDPNLVTFEDWAPGALPQVSEGNLNLFGIGEGKIGFCWGEANSVETEPNATILMLQGRAKQQTRLSDAIHLASKPARIEAYGPDGEEMNLVLHFTRPDGTNVPASAAYELYQNQPNPFNGSTSIRFHIPATKALTMSIFDISGRLVFEQKRTFEKGFNEWVIQARDLPQRGVFSYRLQSDDWTATKKMVRN